MKTLWISICIALIIASVDAQRNFNLSKPIVSLEKRQRPMTWLRPPEERRKLSIFPKNNMKFIVTPKTVVKSEETATTDPPTQRPLMRKFIVRDKNEKGSWYFAPRQPLMKTNRFTVTMAPQGLSKKKDDSHSNLKHNDEMADESKKINTVINNSKTRQEFNKDQIKKGNLIEVSRNKKLNGVTSKNAQVNKVNEKDAINKQTNITIKNDTTFDNLSDTVSEDGDYEIRTENVSMKSDESKIINKSEDGNESRLINKPLPLSNIEETLGETIEGRSLDLNDMTLVDRHEHNGLRLDTGASSRNVDGSSSRKVLETLIEKIQNGTANFNSNPPVLYKDESIKILITNEMVSDIPQEGSVETNNFEQQDLTKNAANTTEKSVVTFKAEALVPNHQGNFSSEKQNVDIDIVEHNTHKPVASTTQFEITPQDYVTFVSDLPDVPQTQLPAKLFTENFGNSVTEGIIFQATISAGTENTILSEALNGQLNITDEVLNDVIINDFIPVTEVSNELSVNILDNKTNEHVSNESLIDKSNNPTSEEDSNESYLTGEESSNKLISDKSNNLTTEASNESLTDKSNNYTDEISNESIVDKINNLTDEEISNESNIAGEEILNESISDKSNNLTEETSNESLIDKSNNYTDEISSESTLENKNNLSGEGISNDSNMAGEEISNESVEDSNNLTEELSNSESLIGISLTNKDVSNEPIIDKSSNLTGEDISDEHNLTSGRNVPNRFKRSNNIIEEENLPTTVSGYKYTGHEVRLGHDLSFKNINA